MQERGCCKSQLYEDWVGGQPSAHRAPVPSSFCTASGRAGSSAGACSDASAEGSSDASDENSLNFWSLDSGFGVLGSSHCSRTQGQFEQRLRLAEHASIASGQLRFRDMLPRTCRKISLMCVVWGSRSRDLPFWLILLPPFNMHGRASFVQKPGCRAVRLGKDSMSCFPARLPLRHVCLLPLHQRSYPSNGEARSFPTTKPTFWHRHTLLLQSFSPIPTSARGCPVARNTGLRRPPSFRLPTSPQAWYFRIEWILCSTRDVDGLVDIARSTIITPHIYQHAMHLVRVKTLDTVSTS